MDKEQLSEAKTKQDGIHGDGQKKKKILFLRVHSHSALIYNWYFFFFAGNLEVMF